MSLQENGRRQKSQVCEVFDHLFSLLEERKAELTLRINGEQEEKLDYIRGLNRKYSEYLNGSIKLLETAIQNLDECEMAVFLQVNLNAAHTLTLNGAFTFMLLIKFLFEHPPQSAKPLLQR